MPGEQELHFCLSFYPCAWSWQLCPRCADTCWAMDRVLSSAVLFLACGRDTTTSQAPVMAEWNNAGKVLELSTTWQCGTAQWRSSLSLAPFYPHRAEITFKKSTTQGLTFHWKFSKVTKSLRTTTRFVWVPDGLMDSEVSMVLQIYRLSCYCELIIIIHTCYSRFMYLQWNITNIIT